MSSFECYVCYEQKTDGVQACEQAHIMCKDCYQKLNNKITCPFCRQKNPLFEQKVCNIGLLLMDTGSEIDSDSDIEDSEDEQFQLAIFVRDRLMMLFQLSEFQNQGNPEPWH